MAKRIRDKSPGALGRLRDLIHATCLRRTKATAGLATQLPVKSERVESIILDEEDRQIYTLFQKKAEDLATRPGSIRPSDQLSGRRILSLITILRRICDHGRYMVPQSAFDLLYGGSEKPAINSTSPDIIDSCSRCGADLENVLAENLSSPTENDRLCFACRMTEVMVEEEDSPTPIDCGDETPKPNKYSETLPDTIPPSAKVKALLENILNHSGKR